MGVTAVDDTSFDEYVNASAGLVLVDFGAEWCEPCQAMEPLLEQIAEAYGERLRVVRLDVEQSPDTAERLRVMSLPTLVFLNNGDELARVTGAHGKQRLVAQVEAALAKADP
jgi:thioredoxin 1